jgi:TetR/AcrR family transcriptional regulator, transcriptional repressor for nem operon
MVKGAFRSPGRREQGLDAQTIVALLQQHAEPRVDQALLGRMHYCNVLDIVPRRSATPESKVIDAYISEVHAGLDDCLRDHERPPLARVRHCFELTQQKYQEDGYMGCLMGGLGQELSGVSEVFRLKIEWCFSSIAERVATCLDEARQKGEIPTGCDVRQMADLWVDCWEGAALRSRLRRNPASLNAMLDFYIRSVVAG